MEARYYINAGGAGMSEISETQSKLDELMNEYEVAVIGENRGRNRSGYSEKADKYYQKRRELKEFVARLEAERRWIPDDTQTSTIVCGKENEMRVFKDGNAWCFVLPDFQDLQVSSSVWMKEGVLDKIYKELRSVRNE
jgi:hypothetical protein